MKYYASSEEGEILPNLLGLSSVEEISISEFEGFVKAEIIFTERLSVNTNFNLNYILNLHKEALSHLYSFAGKLRTVNLSKGGFTFPAAKFLERSMRNFETTTLSKLPSKYEDKEELIKDIAKVHGELLFIHPFREGNGRTARVLANLMARKAGYKSLDFEKITEHNFENYVQAVQRSASQDFTKMEGIIKSIFPS